MSQKTPRPDMGKGGNSVKRCNGTITISSCEIAVNERTLTFTDSLYIPHEITSSWVEFAVLPSLQGRLQHQRGLAHVQAKLIKMRELREYGWIIWQTGIHASPIQALPIIFLGSSYRNMTWNVIMFSPDQTASFSVSNWNSQCVSNKVSIRTHDVFLHASLHVIKIFHLFWLVIASDWSLAPFTYLRKNRSTVMPWGSNHQVRVVLNILLKSNL